MSIKPFLGTTVVESLFDHGYFSSLPSPRELQSARSAYYGQYVLEIPKSCERKKDVITQPKLMERNRKETQGAILANKLTTKKAL